MKKKEEDLQGSKVESTEAGASEETDVIQDLSLANAHQQHPEPIPDPSENEKGVLEDIDPDESIQMPTRQTHNRQPSLSLQSQLRSSSFRRTSVSQAQTSPPLGGGKSPTLPILSPDGDTVNEIYRKQTARIDELERENRRLSKDAKEAEARLKKTEEELEELRESSSEVAELKLKAEGADAKAQEIEKLVRLSSLIAYRENLCAKFVSETPKYVFTTPTSPITISIIQVYEACLFAQPSARFIHNF